MNIKKNVDVPANIGKNKLGELNMAVKEFVESDDINMKIECDSAKESGRYYSTVCGFVNRCNLPLKVTKSMNDIYIVRK